MYRLYKNFNPLKSYLLASGINAFANERQLNYKMKILFFLIFIFESIVISGYPTIPKGFCNQISVTGVRKVTTITHDKWSIVCNFDRQGFLNREQRFYKGELKADYAYEYKITDSVLVTIVTDRENQHIKLVKKSEDYLSPSGKCYKCRVYMNGSESASLYVDNFVYDGDLLISYDVATAWQKRNGKASKVHYYYNKKKQKILETKSFNGTDSVVYSYDKMGRLTGETKTSDSLSILSGIVPYADNELNKDQLTYSHFDNKGNWTKSYYTTQEGKIFRSKRKIEYW